MRFIRVKMAILLLTISLVSVILSTFLLSEFDRYHFRMYVHQNMQMRIEKTAVALSQAYAREGSWQPSTGIDLGQYNLQQGIQMKLLDIHNQPVWNFIDNAGEYNQSEPLPHERIPIKNQGETVGYIEVAYSDPPSYTELDKHYVEGMTQGSIASILIAAAMAMIVSWWISRRMTRPLSDMTRLAQQMREGKLHLRAELPREHDELWLLAQSLNHLAEELQKQEKLKKNLTADVVHELRTPLTTLNSHLHALIDGIWEPTPQRLQDCHEEVERLIALSSNLEILTKAESQSLTLNLQKENIVEATYAVARMMDIAFQEKGVTLQLCDASPCYALIDRDKWKQIVINLLENALKYTNEGGIVSIQVRQAQFEPTDRKRSKHSTSGQKRILVMISDTGQGIPAQHLPYIFERFYRADPSRTRSTGGAGIGLAIVKNLVGAHGGTIKVESEPGRGTAFTIDLPEA